MVKKKHEHLSNLNLIRFMMDKNIDSFFSGNLSLARPPKPVKVGFKLVQKTEKEIKEEKAREREKNLVNFKNSVFILKQLI